MIATTFAAFVLATCPSQDQDLAAFVESLGFETGTVTAASGAARIDLPEGWAYLQAADARRVVEDLWGNPPDEDTLGFIDPPSEDGRLGADFGIIVSYSRDGYVDDKDAAEIDYSDLLRDMQRDAREESKALVAAGYSGVDIIGWAEPPHYDAATKKLYWAKELSFDGNPEHTLNYDVRVLGRHGNLTLQAVSGIGDLKVVDDGMQAILASVHFNEGHRYSDFNPSMDKVAAYGIGGLVAGKVLAKVGVFALIAKFGKVIVIGVIAAFVGLRRLFTRRTPEPATEPQFPDNG